jgi:hypothetical protein
VIVSPSASEAGWAANTTIEVSAADLANAWVQGGSTTGSETLWVRAFDGSDWGAWDTFNVTSTNTTPVAAVSDRSVHVDQWAKVGSWINVSDADNDAITKYQFWDSGSAATSAYFWTQTNFLNIQSIWLNQPSSQIGLGDAQSQKGTAYVIIQFFSKSNCEKAGSVRNDQHCRSSRTGHQPGKPRYHFRSWPDRLPFP